MKLEEFIASQKGRHVRTADLLRAIAASVRDLNKLDNRQHPYAPRVERLVLRDNRALADFISDRRSGRFRCSSYRRSTRSNISSS